ncbi:MAG: hypothetical protein QNK37_32715 [Acidobacteriota bacterium]|nr:hypothetical protein [Acidobacteriota bacterium]
MFSAVELSIDAFPVPFRRIRLQLQPGELAALSGPGAADLLTALAGRIPGAGYVLLDGRTKSPGSLEHAASVALVRRNPIPNCNLRVEEVVALGRAPHAGQGCLDCDDVIVAAALEWTGLTHFRKRRYRDLAPRERHTLHFAEAVAQIWEKPSHGHRYLFMNEPSEGLSSWHRRQLLHLGRELTREGFGVLAAVPEPGMARGFAGRVMHLRNGLIAFEGDVEEVTAAVTRKRWLRVLPGGMNRFVIPGHA